MHVTPKRQKQSAAIWGRVGWIIERVEMDPSAVAHGNKQTVLMAANGYGGGGGGGVVVDGRC